MSDDLEAHYSNPNIAPRILDALRTELGADVPITPLNLAPLDHFHGRGVVATVEMTALLEPRAGEHILDIGSGIGGPARWLAWKFGCTVTGVDLTRAFCDAAQALNIVCGIEERVRILHGSALNLPVADGTFDRAYSQNVVMNIEDKAAMYREAFRALKPGGRLVLSNLARGPDGPPFFPVPWASTPAQSFLADDDTTRRDLTAAGFDILSFTDTTATILPSQIALLSRLEADGSPKLGIHVWQRAGGVERQINSLRSQVEGRTRSVEILARKPE